MEEEVLKMVFFLWKQILQISASQIEHDVLQLTMLPKFSMMFCN
jgi:hypothetical protein